MLFAEACLACAHRRTGRPAGRRRSGCGPCWAQWAGAAMLRQVPRLVCPDTSPLPDLRGLSLWRTNLGPACKHCSQSTAPKTQDWQPSDDLGLGSFAPTLS